MTAHLTLEQIKKTNEKKRALIMVRLQVIKKYTDLIDSVDKNRNTLLHKVISLGGDDASLLNDVLGLNPNPFIQNKEGKTPLLLAQEKKSPLTLVLKEYESAYQTAVQELIAKDKVVRPSTIKTRFSLENKQFLTMQKLFNSYQNEG